MKRVAELLRLGALAALIATTATTQRATAVQINTWSACAFDAAPDGFPSLNAQCATATVPLCAGGICTDADGQTISLFLKRIVAANASSSSTGSKTATTTARNVWVVPDRSDYVLPTQTDTQMQLIYRQLGGDASVYTLDQRGTGRSSQIQCDQSSAIDSVAVQRCAQALRVVLGQNLVAFSLTSAAYDLVSLITVLHAKSDVFVYGLGYGTLVVERLLHFGLAPIKGYILDGATTTSGAKKSAFAYISKADDAFGQVATTFLTLCDKDATCASKFSDKSVSQVLTKLLARLDDASVTDDANCASVFSVNRSAGSIVGRAETAATAEANDPASYRLRRSLAMLMQNTTERAFVPVIVYRLQRCSTSDKRVLTQLFSRLEQREAALLARQEVVDELIAFSELWESPSAMETKLLERFTDTSMSLGRVYGTLQRYCLFTLDASDACVKVLEPSSIATAAANATRLAYARDAYWNTAATIPSTASVLLLSGALDGQAPLSNAQALVDALRGTSKELLAFPAAAHNVLMTSTRSDGASCGLAILESYVTNRGDLNKYDTTCIDKLPSLSFALTRTATLAVLGTTNAYDGELLATLPVPPTPSPLTSASGSGVGSDSGASKRSDENAALRETIRRYRVAFIVAVALLLLLLVGCGIALLRWWRDKQYEDELAALEGLRLNQELGGFDEVAHAERIRKLHLASTINVRSSSLDDSDWYAAGSEGLLPLPLSRSNGSSSSQGGVGRTPLPLPLDWNFRSHPRNTGESDDDDESLPQGVRVPPFSDWAYSSSNHLRM